MLFMSPVACTSQVRRDQAAAEIRMVMKKNQAYTVRARKTARTSFDRG